MLPNEESAVSLFERIRLRLPAMSASFRKVADFVADHYQEVAFLPAAKVAARCGVSESVVVRFATALGYDGYPDMVRSIQEQVRRELAPVARLEALTLTQQSGAADVLQSVLLQDAANLTGTAEDAANGKFGAVLSAVVNAQEIYICGFRGLRHLAGLLAFLLDTAGARVRLLSHGDVTLFEEMRRIGRKDVLIAFSFSRYTRRTMQAVEFARGKGATTLVITDSVMAPVAQSADYLLRARITGHSFFNSYVAAVGLINALVTGYAITAHDKVLRSLKNLEETLPSDEFFGA